MEERDMEDLLKYYEPNVVPSLEDLRLGKEPGIAEFDGSFGWWV
jgi:precorrin-2 dehydrogenase/sirohydrochlorin ferrochelatase